MKFVNLDHNFIFLNKKIIRRRKGENKKASFKSKQIKDPNEKPYVQGGSYVALHCVVTKLTHVNG